VVRSLSARYAPAVIRALFLLLFGTLLLAAEGGPYALSPAGAVLVSETAADDCCPPRPGQSDEQGDCCDYDFGLCCAAGAVALAAPPPSGRAAQPAAAPARLWVLPPPGLLHNRAIGPPPTPPPIG